jgi:hypothetical protein
MFHATATTWAAPQRRALFVAGAVDHRKPDTACSYLPRPSVHGGLHKLELSRRTQDAFQNASGDSAGVVPPAAS